MGDDEDTVPGLDARARAARGGPASPDVEDTVARPIRDRPRVASGPAAPPPAAAPPAPPPSAAPPAPPPAAAPPVAVTTARVVVRDGPSLPLDVPVRIGRRPAPPRIPERVALVTVPSAGGTVSSSHLEIRPSGHGAVLHDLDSLNGSLVEVPGSVPRLLARGDSMVVPVGTRVVLGDGVEVSISPPEGEERS